MSGRLCMREIDNTQLILTMSLIYCAVKPIEVITVTDKKTRNVLMNDSLRRS
ncbi:hypothetical protein GCM10009409_03910 [Shewanella saliphila]|uniref:Uncharacterized protein n=1 Tax=Shewanella saliphila TaxID=2282698 RepID=A0ABQ2Q372_9GAMM|nr:hypothetical protein GCM10009409_03910 [Shewanella saliphila]